VPDKDGRYSGALRIAANFAGAGDVFQEGTHLWLRLAMAVSVKNAPPFTTSEDVEWVPDSTSWRYQAPLTWPKGAEKIAIVVEEISTGLAGSAVVDIPNTP